MWATRPDTAGYPSGCGKRAVGAFHGRAILHGHLATAQRHRISGQGQSRLTATSPSIQDPQEGEEARGHHTAGFQALPTGNLFHAGPVGITKAMAACPNRNSERRTSFIVTPYSASKDGRMIPARPTVCPRTTPDEPPCHLVVDHWRDRATGPCFPLLVLCCTTHGRAFTLYPPGHVPYGRVVIAPVASDGTDLGGALDPAVDQAERFRGTIFDAALDAAAGHPWAREYTGESDWTGPWWGGMRRRLDMLLACLGLAPDLDPAERQKRARALDLDLLPLIEASRLLAAHPGYRQRGQAVTAILGELAKGLCIFERLLLAGYLAGLWAEPMLWDAHHRTLRSLAGERRCAQRSPPGPGPPRLRSIVRSSSSP